MVEIRLQCCRSRPVTACLGRAALKNPPTTTICAVWRGARGALWPTEAPPSADGADFARAAVAKSALAVASRDEYTAHNLRPARENLLNSCEWRMGGWRGGALPFSVRGPHSGEQELRARAAAAV